MGNTYKIPNPADVDEEILALFPSLSQKRRALKTRLQILVSAADGFVTQFLLTKGKAKVRMGGNQAKRALIELEHLKLLKIEEASGLTGVRKEGQLTPKGVVALMILRDCQKKKFLTPLLEIPLSNPLQKSAKTVDITNKPRVNNVGSSKLAAVLRLFNDTHFRTAKTNPEISPAVTAIKALKNLQQHNLELKTEDEIADDLRMIDEQMFLDSQKIDIPSFNSYLPLWLSELDSKKQNEIFLQLMVLTKMLTNSNLTLETKQKKMESLQKFDRQGYLFLTSQEIYLWRKAGLQNPSIDEVWAETAKRSGKEGSTLDEISDEILQGKPGLDFEKVLKTMQKILFERFFFKQP